ncbi:hypothetical protein Bpfe_015455, partial [Biomphalaria pfeifferi]
IYLLFAFHLRLTSLVNGSQEWASLFVLLLLLTNSIFTSDLPGLSNRHAPFVCGETSGQLSWAMECLQWNAGNSI